MQIKEVMKKIEDSNGSNCLTELLKEAARDPQSRKSFIENPQRLIEERLGVNLPKDMKIILHQNTENNVHIALPLDPSSVGLEDSQLDIVSGGSLDDPFAPAQPAQGSGPMSMVLHNNSPLAQAIGGVLVGIALSFIPS